MGREWISIFLHIPSSEPYIVPVHTMPPIAVSEIEVFNEDGGPHMRSIGSSDLCAPNLTSLGGISALSREVVDTTVAFHG